jgi:hypothetical protein
MSVCLCVFVSVRLSVYLFISQKKAYFQPGLYKLLIYAVWAYADIFMQDFFRTWDPKREKRAFGEQPNFTQRSK